MSYFRIILVVLLGVSLIQALPTSKPTSKPTSARTKLSSKAAGLRAKTLATEEKNIDAERESEMAIETAEKPATGDRKKKSAATTFCVEIRPTANGGLTKNCDPPAPIPTPLCDEHEKHERHYTPPTLPPQPEEPIHQDMPILIEQPFSILPQQQQALACLQPPQPSMPYLSPPVAPCTCPCSPLPFTTRFHSHMGRSYLRGSDNLAQTNDYSQSSGYDSQPPSYIEIQQPPSYSALTSDALYTKDLERNAERSSMDDNYQTPVMTDQSYRYEQTPGSYASAIAASEGSQSGASFRLGGPTFTAALTAPQMSIELPHGSPRYYQSSLAMQSVLPNSGYMAYYPSAYSAPMGYRSSYRTYEPKQASPANSVGSPCNQQVRSQRQQGEEPRRINGEEKTFEKSEIMSPREMLNKMRGLETRGTTTTGQKDSWDDDKKNDEGTKEDATTDLTKNRTNEEEYFASKSADFGKRETQTSINLNKELVKSST